MACKNILPAISTGFWRALVTVAIRGQCGTYPLAYELLSSHEC